MFQRFTKAAFSTCLLFIFGGEALAQDKPLWLDIELGKSTVVDIPSTAKAVAVTDPTIAEPVLLGGLNRVMVQGKAVGTTDFVIQQQGSAPPIFYQVVVHRDLSDMVRRVDEIVEGEPPNIYPLDQRIVVEGPVADLETLERIAQIAKVYDDEFVNLMSVEGDHQVQLEVVFAEVSRTGLRELGLNVLWGDSNLGIGMMGPNATGSSFVSHPQLVDTISSGLVPPAAAGAFNVLGYIGAIDLATIISAMDDQRISKILAQPTLVALSGQQAEFLSGGEIPVPVPSGNGNISIEYKEYGIKLGFVPTVLGGDVIDVRVQVEVSQLDPANSTKVLAIEVPGLLARKAKSHLRIGNGMTFAMAGLLTEKTSSTRAQVPGLGAIPVLGTFFRYTKHVKEETELMIFVTPRLVRPLGPGEVPAAPGTTDNANPSELELFLLGMLHHGGSRTAEPTGEVGLQR